MEIDDGPSITFMRRTLAEVIGAWLGDATTAQIKAAYAAYIGAAFMPVRQLREILGA
jgi:hypothetical protein